VVSAVDTNNNINYATGASYDPAGGLTGFVSGGSSTFAGITNSFSYNKRMQPVNMSAASPSGTIFSLNYDFHLGVANNGNVWGITNNKDSSRSQTFGYDPLNRLISAQNAATDCTKTTVNGKAEYWGNSYGYDAWGNLLAKKVTKCSAETLDRTADGQNRLHVKAGADYQYDSAGNMTYDAAGQYYTFDQENRITGANGFTYTYDADGNRVVKANGSTGTLYWYMLPGIVAESDLSGNLQSEYVFFNGERVARRDNPGGSSSTVAYYFSDHLKTTDIVIDAVGNIRNESDFYPWGGELQLSNNDSNHYKFTGKERDGETGLDYFGARFYSNGLGRFVSADWSAVPTPVPYASFSNPQSLNLYTYASNSPSTFADLNGHYDVAGSGACQGKMFCDGPSDQDKKKDGAKTDPKITQEIQDLKAKEAFDLQMLIGLYKGQSLLSLFGAEKASNPTQALGMKLMSAGLFLFPGGQEREAAQVVRVIAKGEKLEALMNELKVLTFESGGSEHAIVTLKNGTRLIVRGGENGFTVAYNAFGSKLRRIIVHTHYRTTGPSPEDFQTLRDLKQKYSWIYEFFGGGLTKFRNRQ
jgi:RHS repeat-associated protein